MRLRSTVFGAIVARYTERERELSGFRITVVTAASSRSTPGACPGRVRLASFGLCGGCVIAGDSPARLLLPHDTIARCMSAWSTRLGLTREALFHSLRTAIAAVVSTLLARALKLPEFYWAPISTIVILLSVTYPLALAWQRFVGTALGAALGALIATFFNANWMVYGAGILVCGILSALLRLGSAYRFAAITLTIVLLIAHGRRPGSSPRTGSWKYRWESRWRCW